MIKKIAVFIFLIVGFFAKSQTANEPQMADGFRQDGKIYIVISVIAMIFIAIVLFLVFLERKVKRLEKKLKD
jgi:CcmD family protein